MSRSPAAAILRALLDEAPGASAVHLGWDTAWPVAVRNAVGVRLADRLRALGTEIPPAVAASLAAVRDRNAAAMALIRRLGAACEREGLPCLFPKAFQHWPDMGSDIDLLIETDSTEVDRAILHGLTVSGVRRGLRHRIAGSVEYDIEGCDAPLEIHHGRLGVLGEHRELAALLLDRSRAVELEGIAVRMLAPEEQLLLQGLQRVHGRRSIRLSDLVATIRVVRDGGLEWDRIVATARRLGFLDETSCYLGYVEQVHREVFGRPLLPAEMAFALPLRGWGRIEFRAGAYRLPVARVHRRLYGAKLRAAAARGDWRRLSRLCLAPVVATAALAGRAIR